MTQNMVLGSKRKDKMMENWKTILALTVFILPLAYCEIQRTEDESAVKIACIEKRGEWVRGNCVFE